jgi:hypothetical protein
MTFENRCSVEPLDILAVSFECSKCGAASRIPLNKLDALSTSSFLEGCRFCLAPSGYGMGTAEHRNLTQFGLARKALADASGGRNLRVKMEIRCSDIEGKP